MGKKMMEILGVALAGAMVLSGCAGVMEKIQTPTLEATPSPTLKPTSTATPTHEVTATATAVVNEEPKLLMDEKIEYGGRQFDFQISTLDSDKMTKEAFEKYGIRSISINENKTNANELLAKTLVYSFLETYNFQNKTNIGMEEFVSNPEKYPANIMMKGKDGKLVEQAITLDQINSFEMRFTYSWDEKLYMGMSSKSSLSVGYGFENGKFTFYCPLSPTDGEIEFLLSATLNLDKVTALPYYLGYSAIQNRLMTALGFMPYSVYSLKEFGDSEIFKDKFVFDGVDLVNESKSPAEMSRNDAQVWFRTHSSFQVSTN